MALAMKPHHEAVFVQAMVQKGMKEVPRRFLQQVSGADVSESGEENLPVIDMGKLLQEDDLEMSRLAQACKEWGFFQVVNHGIRLSLLQDAREAARQFFHLPHGEKLKYAMKPGSCEGYGRHFLVSDNVVLDWVDLLYHQLEPVSTRDMSTWPAQPETYRLSVEMYSKEVFHLARAILGRMSVALLGKDQEGFLESKFGEGGIFQNLRVNYYPPCPQPDLVMGLSPHSDPGGITVLLQDDVEGLQVRKSNGEWMQVKADPKAFVVNIADQIEIITNGEYRSVEHRAVVKSESKERISLAMFHSPSLSAVIAPAPEFVTASRPLRYSPMTFGEYRSTFLNKELKGKSHLESVVLQKQ